LNRPMVQALAGLIVLVVLAAISIAVTNALFNVTASTRPSVTFSLATDSPVLPSTGSTPGGATRSTSAR
jgi:hypothetical protein